MLSTCNRIEVYAVVETFHGGLTEVSSVLARHAQRRRCPTSPTTSTCTTRGPRSSTCSPSPPGSTRWSSARRRSSASCAPRTPRAELRHRRAVAARVSRSTRCGSASAPRPRPGSTPRAPPSSPRRSTTPRRRSASSRGAAPSSSAPARWAGSPRPHLRRAGSARSSWPTAPRSAPSGSPRSSPPTARPPGVVGLDALAPRAGRGRPGRGVHRRGRHRRRPRHGRAPGWSPATARPLVVCDLGLPRDVDPDVGALPGVTLVDLATLQARLAPRAARPGRRRRPALVAEEARGLPGRAALGGGHPHGHRPAPPRRRRSSTPSCCASTRRLPELDPEVRERVRPPVRRVVDKLLHTPTVQVKRLAQCPAAAATPRPCASCSSSTRRPRRPSPCSATATSSPRWRRRWAPQVESPALPRHREDHR